MLVTVEIKNLTALGIDLGIDLTRDGQILYRKKFMKHQ